MGLLAGVNDMELLARTSVGRDINRHLYTAAAGRRRPAAPRRGGPGRRDPDAQPPPRLPRHTQVGGDGSRLALRRSNGTAHATLEADLATRAARITLTDGTGGAIVCEDLLTGSSVLR